MTPIIGLFIILTVNALLIPVNIYAIQASRALGKRGSWWNYAAIPLNGVVILFCLYALFS